MNWYWWALVAFCLLAAVFCFAAASVSIGRRYDDESDRLWLEHFDENGRP